MGTLVANEDFHHVAYKADDRNHLLVAVDKFLEEVTVLPPGWWDPSIRIEPPSAVPSQVLILYSTLVTMHTVHLNIKETTFLSHITYLMCFV
jgi:hypothetical protein